MPSKTSFFVNQGLFAVNSPPKKPAQSRVDRRRGGARPRRHTVTVPVMTGLSAVTGRGACRDRDSRARCDDRGPGDVYTATRPLPQACEDKSHSRMAAVATGLRWLVTGKGDGGGGRGRKAALSRHGPGYRAGGDAGGDAGGAVGRPLPAKRRRPPGRSQRQNGAFSATFPAPPSRPSKGAARPLAPPPRGTYWPV